MQPLTALHAITNRLLDAEPGDYRELFNATDELYKFLITLTGLDTESTVNREHLALDTGNAIGTAWAALCIKDILRTKRFMNGIYKAVCSVKQKNLNKKIHILYAGTGPFATLLLPLTARFSSDELQFTLLEVNGPSYQCLQKTISILQLQDYIRQMVLTDAVTWTLSPTEKIDILVCEALQQALTKEPQVAILMNLAPQTGKDTIIIPEKITLEAALINEQRRIQEKMSGQLPGKKAMHLLGPVFELEKEMLLKTARRPAPGRSGPYEFPSKSIHIPSNLVSEFPVLSILTAIQVFGKEMLQVDECALTLPLKLVDLSDQHQKVEEVVFTYSTGPLPGLQVTFRPG